MIEEMDAFVETGRFKLVDRPERKKVISTKWVYTMKNDKNGEFAKARLVVMGCQDRRQWGDTTTYSTVMNLCIFCYILSAANY